MTQKHKIQLFEEKQVRTVWDDEQEKWFFSIVDVCGVLTEQPDYDHAKNYWKVLKHRLVKEGNESVTNCNQLKLVSPKDGKRYNTDVADFKQLFRVIQSIPSRKAEPFKEWMAQVAAQRIDQQIDGERCLRKKRSRIMDQETRWLKRYNEVEGPEKQTANGYGDSGFGCCLLFMGCFDGFDMLKRL